MTLTVFSITPNTIYGKQLRHEIEQATGIVLDNFLFYPPDEVRIHGDDVAAAQAAIQAVIDVHEPDPLYFPEDVERARAAAAETTVANLPGWATWTEEQALAWYETNVGEPIDNAPEAVTSQNAVAVLQGVVNLLREMNNLERAQIKLDLAIRNKLWPNLEGS